MNLVFVISSNVSAIGYENGIIEVHFRNGSVYQYSNTSQRLFDEFFFVSIERKIRPPTAQRALSISTHSLTGNPISSETNLTCSPVMMIASCGEQFFCINSATGRQTFLNSLMSITNFPPFTFLPRPFALGGFISPVPVFLLDGHDLVDVEQVV